MAEPEGEPKSAAEPEGKKPFSKSLLVKVLIGVALVIALFSMVFATAYYVTQKFRNESLPMDAQGVTPGVKGTTLKSSITHPMGQFTSIITDATGRSFNLRADVVLAINSDRTDKDAVITEIKAREPELKDGINEVLYGMDPQNLVGSPTQRSEGIAELKASIIRAVNARMKNQIDGVLLPEFIFQ